ncbi:MAG: hypothetical protein CEN89_608 [Candidatus Berkelbacteria bacterium Licking1014_7]|uniref:Uncharacterized protein n=1 Tax=Candidatus Berkelbacteria bacterium Licking1014_7 TaxID=2017147 RepID=A0A554LI73_9BACT|nr:MAG: hypothetical protein CEN89_608 [Candidatus Berkelbacteria bacterium Licking1014_7]
MCKKTSERRRPRIVRVEEASMDCQTNSSVREKATSSPQRKKKGH